MSETSQESVRVGVYVCHCGHNIAGVLDVAAVRDYAAQLPHVQVARDNVFCCAEPGQLEIQEDIKEFGLNRIVVAACSPRLHEPTFRRTIKDAGLNHYLLEMVNIREQCSWVHAQDPKAATEKAKDLVAMGVAKASLVFPLSDRQVPMINRALVIGGGLAGMQAALDIADAGHPVCLVERSPFLGGTVSTYWRTFPQGDIARCLIAPMMSRVLHHPLIEMRAGSEVTHVDGYIGNFTVQVRSDPRYVDSQCDLCGRCVEVCEVDRSGGEQRAIYIPDPWCAPPLYAIDHEVCTRCESCVAVCPQKAIDLHMQGEEATLEVGSIVVATGFQPYEPGNDGHYPYYRYANVVTSVELERMLHPQGPTGGKVLRPSDGEFARRVAFLQCVGSREEEGNRYCSRVCCMVSLKQAQALASEPERELTIYYRDMRPMKKFYEDLYGAVRDLGVLFYRGEIQEVEELADQSLRIQGENELLQARTVQEVDLLVLAVGLEPNAAAQPLRDIVKLTVGDDGFFLEAHPKLRPLETVQDGIFLAGTCQGPKDISETVAHASGAAAKANTLLAHETIVLDGLIAEIDMEHCVGCLRCVEQCPFQAVTAVEVEGEEKPKAEVVTAACKGCGVCAGVCPTGAAELLGFTEDQILAQIRAALQDRPGEKILAFACNWCSYAGADFAGVSRLGYPASVRIIRVPCSGRVSERLIREALRLGAGKVLVSGCHPPGDCHYVSGNLRAAERVEKLRRKLAKKGVDPKRLHLEWFSATEGSKFQQVIKNLTEELKKTA
ncbi:MAG: hydrogenase iron-sulfur subunit [Syntrophobacteria bacterium]